MPELKNKIRYSVMPLYGDPSVIVAEGSSLREVLESTFQCKLTHIGDLQIDVEVDEVHGERVTMYGIVSALGQRQDNYCVLCSATVVTYKADEARAAFDIFSLYKLIH